MKHAEIEAGHAYKLRITIPGTPKVTVHKRVTVIDKPGREIVVEHPHPVCVNRDDFPPAELPRAMIDGKLRWEFQPVRRVARAADIVAPADDNTGRPS